MMLPTRKSLLAMLSVAAEACVMKSTAVLAGAASNVCAVNSPRSLDGRYHTGGTFAEPAPWYRSRVLSAGLLLADCVAKLFLRLPTRNIDSKTRQSAQYRIRDA